LPVDLARDGDNPPEPEARGESCQGTRGDATGIRRPSLQGNQAARSGRGLSA